MSGRARRAAATCGAGCIAIVCRGNTPQPESRAPAMTLRPAQMNTRVRRLTGVHSAQKRAGHMRQIRTRTEGLTDLHPNMVNKPLSEPGETPVRRQVSAIGSPGIWDRASGRYLAAPRQRAAHARPAQAAIAHRVLGEVLLVIVLGKIERRRVEDFGGDGVVAAGG